jgi:hypothetical protein
MTGDDIHVLAANLLRMPPAAEPPKDVRLKAWIDTCMFEAPDYLGTLLFHLFDYSTGNEDEDKELRHQALLKLRAAVQDRS